MSEPYELATFSACVGESFRLELEDGESLEWELVEATALPTQEGAPRREPFSLVFRGPAGRLLPQSVYPMRHPRLGALSLFLVPIGSNEQGVSFEAVFN